MEIVISEHSGFCEGVERAYKIALEQAEEKNSVFMLGNLVHNTQVVQKLEHLGIKIVKSLSEIPAGTKGILLISAHGVPPQIYDQVKALGLEIVDTTCPWVKNAQKLAKKITQENIPLVIVGDKDHPEVKGLLGWSDNKAFVVESPQDIQPVIMQITGEKVGVIAQTTQSEENFDGVVSKLREKFINVIVHKTICGATSKRQNAAVNLAKQVDVMLVIGDKKSANTKRLAELCNKTGTQTHQIQEACEFNREWVKGKDKIGITAGASTPEWVISQVIDLLRAL